MSRINTIVLSAIVALTLAACSAGSLPDPDSDGTAGATSPATGTPEVTPRPTEVPGPPVASLMGGGAGPVAGELGTFLWSGLGSDSPWVLPATDLHAALGVALAVTLDPDIPHQRWTAAWAPVRDGGAGRVEAVDEGGQGRIELTAPDQPGRWGLLVELHFPGGQRAAWYWSVVVGP